MKNSIAKFIQNEDGFLGAVLGTAIGGLFGGGSGAVLAKGIGGALGAAYDQRKALGDERAYEEGEILRTVQQARAAGIHPLEAIRSGAANSSGVSPRIGTSASFGEQFDQIDSILTGREAHKDKLRQSQIELNRVEADKMRRSASATVSSTPGAPTSRQPRLTSASLGAPTHTDDVISKPSEVTSVDIDAGQPDADLTFSNPLRPDAGSLAEREGEAESVQEYLGLFNTLVETPRYNSLLTDFAEMEGTTREAINEQIKAGGHAEWTRLRDKWFKSNQADPDAPTVFDNYRARPPAFPRLPARNPASGMEWGGP